jgi:hypothetical protein
MKYALRCELDRIREQLKTEGMECFDCFRWKSNAFANTDIEKLILEMSLYLTSAVQEGDWLKNESFW